MDFPASRNSFPLPMSPTPPDSLSSAWRRAVASYLLATVVLGGGLGLAAARYPGSFDWVYTVISALASRKHNPAGAAWFAGALAVAMACLWPAAGVIIRDEARTGGFPRGLAVALRAGVVCGSLVDIERLAFFHLSDVVRKGHEAIAFVAFLSFYLGVVGTYLHRVRRGRASGFSAALVVLPLLGVGLREGWLYYAQRHLGWADYDWKGTGAPFWLSFAWWQWLAAAMLWLSVGHLLVTAGKGRGREKREGAGSRKD